MAVKQHLHTYQRVGRNGSKRYRCTDPHCTHVSYKDLLEGKAASCPECGREFILDSYCFKLKVPKCPECSNEKRRKEEYREKEQFKETVDKVIGDIIV